MKATVSAALVVCLLLGSVRAQEEPAVEIFLPDLMEDVSYAETLTLLELSREQLEGLLMLQMQWVEAGTPDERIGLAFQDFRALVIGGRMPEEAMAQLDPLRPEMQQFQERVERARREGVEAVMGLLDKNQLGKLALQHSPARGLQNFIRVLADTRNAPAEQWQQMRGRMTNALMDMARREGGAELNPDDIAATLDTLRALPEEELRDGREELAGKLARQVVPQAMERLESGEHRERLLRDVANRLLTYRKASDIVRERLEAAAGN